MFGSGRHDALSGAVAILETMFMMTFGAAFDTKHYDDVRVRTEAFDLEYATGVATLPLGETTPA